MELIINEENLQTSVIEEFSTKVRTILINENNNPRNVYFQKELITIFDAYKKLN